MSTKIATPGTMAHDMTDDTAYAHMRRLRTAWADNCRAEYERTWRNDYRLDAAVADLSAADLRALSHAKLLAEVAAGKTEPQDCWGGEMLVTCFMNWLRVRDRAAWEVAAFWAPAEFRGTPAEEAEFREQTNLAAKTWEDFAFASKMLSLE